MSMLLKENNCVKPHADVEGCLDTSQTLIQVLNPSSGPKIFPYLWFNLNLFLKRGHQSIKYWKNHENWFRDWDRVDF